MVTFGGIQDPTELKFLVLFVLHQCGQPLAPDVLNDILLRDGLVDFFEFTTAMEELTTSGHIHQVLVDGEKRYETTALGEEAAELFRRDLTPTVRDTVTTAAQEVLQQRRQDSQIQAIVRRNESGSFQAHLELREGESPLLSLTLATPSREQASLICGNFRKAPAETFSRIIQILTTSQEE
ncbi:MAG: DUF4364 family protein [Eubacteriales bacterium]